MAEDFRSPELERLLALSACLRRGAEVEDSYGRADPAWRGASGSQAELERTETGPIADAWWTPRAVSTAFAACRLQLVAMADHLVSLSHLLPTRSEDGTLTPLVIARSVIETGARAWWVVDPNLAAQQRVARGCAEQLYSAYQAERLASAMTLPEGVAGISPELIRLRNRVADLGFSLGNDPDRPQVGSEQRPRPTKLVADFLDDTMYRQYRSGVYPLYSAVAHGTQFGLLRAYRDEGARAEGERVYRRAVDQRDLDAAAGLSMAAFIAVLRRVVLVMGWGRVLVDLYEHRVRRLLVES
jgi:hypothetical protein